MIGPEKTIQDAIVNALQAKNVLVLFLQFAGGRGFPDISAFKNGKACFIEVKRLDGGKISKQQQFVSKALCEAGITTFLATGLDIVPLILAELGVK